MAPISEKRASTQHKMSDQDVIQAKTATSPMLKEKGLGGGLMGHGHGHHHSHHNSSYHHPHYYQPSSNLHLHYHHPHHSKENSGSRTGLEILDFHESWLEEMEVYKDMMHVKKLGSHNSQVHNKVQINPMDVINCHNLNSMKMSQVILDGLPLSQGLPISQGLRMSGGSSMPPINIVNPGNVKRRIVNENKTRIRVGTTMAAAEAVSAENQVHLKRPREDTPSKTAGGGKHIAVVASSAQQSAKRYSNSSSTNQSSAAASNDKPHRHHSNSTKPSATNTTASASTNSPRSNLKIIVNQFHASSLLNGHQLEEKEKILAQNGLTNNAPATAYEASYYAANYLNPDGRNTSPLNGNKLRTSQGESNNYVGVSLAKNYSGDHDFDKADDDPSAAIDDVNTYSDSDSDEEYTGEPFYMRQDSDDTLQSKEVCYHSPRTTKTSDENAQEHCEYYTPNCILSPSLFPNVPPYLNYSSHSRPGPSMPQPLHKVLKWKLSPVMPKIVKRVVLNSGFRIIKNTMDWMAVWEKHMKSPGFRTIRSHQKYNHMPGSFRIGRKDSMWRSIQLNMKRFGSKEFGFMQKSYVMPDDLEELRLAWPKSASRLAKWIVKPPASARGTGISIINKWSQFPKDRPLVVQRYIEKPLLINDNKFDMRIYVVLTSVNPLRIYMYKDGLARFASVKYSSELNNLDERCMHLTNYSINKFSQNYSKNEDFNACQGHKWTLQSLWSCLEERGVNTKRLWATLRNLVIKALISGESGLNRMYRQNVNFRYNCFEMFGFDVLLDENLVPWLLEINISPSLHSELPLDLHVKGPLIQAVLNTALYQVPPKLSEKQQRDILEELKLEGPLCHDKRIFTTCLKADEIRKHNQFTNRSIEYREEYLEAILDHLNPDDVRCLIITEDELNRCSPLERIFPTPDTHKYLKFVEHPRYYNRLLDAWEHRYGRCREKGIEILRAFCKDNYHLQVPEAINEKEPTTTLTDIDLLHVKREDSQNLPIIDDSSSAVQSASKSCDADSIDDRNTTALTDTSSQASTINDDTATNSVIEIKPKETPQTKNKTLKSPHQYQLHHQPNSSHSSKDKDSKDSASHTIKTSHKSKHNDPDRKEKTDKDKKDK